jgi:hypothetical protein
MLLACVMLAVLQDFKSEKQVKNHEASKAHKKKLSELDATLLKEALADRLSSIGEGNGSEVHLMVCIVNNHNDLYSSEQCTAYTAM